MAVFIPIVSEFDSKGIDKAIREFNSRDDIKVIMLSSERTASGTNLTKAENVILLDPVYGTYEYRRILKE
mgnify:CR=1 FL=1